MTPMVGLLIAWGILTAILIILLIYKSTLTMHEDDQLFLDDHNSHMQEEQTELLTRMLRLQEKTVADVDTRFRVAGKPGSATDCGRVYILLGAPDDVKRESGAAAGPRLS